MTARHIIDGASFGPDALEAMRLAFEKAWKVVDRECRNAGLHEREQARACLAKAILSVTSYDSRDPEALKTAALATLMPDLRSAPPSPS